jgi:outer membrane protein
MVRIVRPSTLQPAVQRARQLGWIAATLAALALAGCATKGPRKVPPPEPTPQISSAASVSAASAIELATPDPLVNPAAAQVAAGDERTVAQAAGDPAGQASESDLQASEAAEQVLFTLDDAIEFALANNPRLRSASAAILKSSGEEQAAFAPFLPQVDLLGQMGSVSSTLAPGVPGNEGFMLANGTGTRTYAQAELGLQWMLFDFGRTSGRHMEALWRARITEFQLVRARQSVEFDVAAAYLDVLLANASRRVEEDAVRRAEAIRHDTNSRHVNGDALREDVLRADVQLSESRENLIRAREREFDALAGLNNVMGRNASLPLEVAGLEMQPPLAGSLESLLGEAAAMRPEVRIAQQAVAAAQAGRRAAQADFLPEVFARASAGATGGEYVVTGWQQGAGLHLVSPVYDGGKRRGELRAADGEVQAAFASAQQILDTISLQVNLAYRSMMASQECIALARTAVAQAEENLRIISVRYTNGDATPTDIVDSEAALTRAQQRYYRSTFTYLVALARIDYVTGQSQTSLPPRAAAVQAEELPIQFPGQADTMSAPPLPSPRRLPEVRDGAAVPNATPSRFQGAQPDEP